MAVYNFSFDPKYVGHEATITDHTGTEVAGSPVTLDANGDASLGGLVAGTYRAQVANAEGAFGDGYSVVDGVFDILASIAAAGGATAGLGTEDFYLEMTTPTNAATIAFDTIPDNCAVTDGFITGIPAGYYRFDLIQVDFTRPAETHAAKFQFITAMGANVGIPAVAVYPDGASNIACGFKAQIHLPIPEGDGLLVGFNETCVDGTVSPDPLELSYMYISATKIL